MRNVYMIYKGKKAVLSYNKRRAIAIAKQYDASIRFMPYQEYKSRHIWDMPTFYMCSNPLN